MMIKCQFSRRGMGIYSIAFSYPRAFGGGFWRRERDGDHGRWWNTLVAFPFIKMCPNSV